MKQEISYCIEIPSINVIFCSPLNCPIFRGRETEIERMNELLSFESKPPFYTLLCMLLCPLARCYCTTGSVGGRLQCWGRQGFSHSCLLLVGFLWASWPCQVHQHQQSSTLSLEVPYSKSLSSSHSKVFLCSTALRMVAATCSSSLILTVVRLPFQSSSLVTY